MKNTLFSKQQKNRDELLALLKNNQPSKRKVLKEGELLPPPTPHTCWLECAISNLALSSISMNLSADGYYSNYEMILEAVVAEYVELRKATGIVVAQKTIDDLLNVRIPNLKG